MIPKTPHFAVVGHPNKGKSSIVATLAHNDSIAISNISGTTTRAHYYPMMVDGQTLYVLIDTPGFQRPRQMLDWLQLNTKDSSGRHSAIQQFIREHQQDGTGHYRFKDEVELLSPIIRGAGIIYVVDGSQPYSAEYEAEMTILQWTGQPRMALINPIGGDQYVEQWSQVLRQYFSLTRVFNPLAAQLNEQLALIESFKILHLDWAPLLDDAIACIQQKNVQTHAHAAFAIAEDLSQILAYELSLPMLNGESNLEEALKLQLKSQYRRTIRQSEFQLHRRLKNLYQHDRVATHVDELSMDYADLFDQEQWFLFGLSRTRLLALSASAGAAAGGILDVGLGGASFMTGALLGGLASGTATLYAMNKPENIRIKGVPLGGQQLTIGPVKNLQFAMVLLGRAIDLQRKLALRVHAEQKDIHIDDHNSDWLAPLSSAEQVKLSGLLLQTNRTPLQHTENLAALIKKLLL